MALLPWANLQQHMKDFELFQACALLFGEEVIIGRGFLDYLQPAGLKQAYRQRARETHPDLSSVSSAAGKTQFHDIQQAYQLLASYLRRRELRNRRVTAASPPHTPCAKPGTPRPASSLSLANIEPIILAPSGQPIRHRASIDRLYQGPLPERPLLFGHFLYYCGLTTWRTITAVLVQQQRGRPRCGELGTRLGLLQPTDIHHILKRKAANTPFGETAMALGLLDERQLRALLRYQRQQQKKFGTILVEKELLSLRELTFLLMQFRRHNRLHSSR